MPEASLESSSSVLRPRATVRCHYATSSSRIRRKTILIECDNMAVYYCLWDLKTKKGITATGRRIQWV
jgi:hypothetical protein